MTTALDIINDAHLFAGIGDAVNALDGNSVALGLRTFNSMLDSWSTEELSIFDIVEGTFPLLAGVASYSIGAGQSLGSRPISTSRVAIVDAQNVTHEVRICGVTEWSQIIYKPAAGRPEVVYIDNNAPLSTWQFWPTPSFSNDILHAWYWATLATYATLTTTVLAPPGYIWAMVTGLGVTLAPFHQKPVTPDMTKIASQAYWNMRGLNRQPKIMDTDIPYTTARSAFNIYSGSP